MDSGMRQFELRDFVTAKKSLLYKQHTKVCLPSTRQAAINSERLVETPVEISAKNISPA
jgi:hypothetical protein